jgi:lysophospholipase L1-like esterase
MARLAHDAGIRAVFITAPSSHERGHEPEYPSRRHLRHLEELVPLHASYAQATREAAAAGGAQVCDAADEFTRLPGPIGQYFNSDGIHFNDRGSRALAEILTDCLAAAPAAAVTTTKTASTTR